MMISFRSMPLVWEIREQTERFRSCQATLSRADPPNVTEKLAAVISEEL
jgi:hypothetical protein